MKTNEETAALIAEAREEESIQDKLGDGFSEGSEERAFYYEHRDRYGRLADALEAATSVPVPGEPNDDRENLITERTYGHGSITLTHYRSSGRIGVVQRGENSVMDVTDLLVFLQDSGLDEDFSRATVPDAAQTLCVECNEVEVLGKPEHRVLCMDCAYETGRAAVPDAANRELTEAIRLTVEYVGNDMLPAIEGWDWYDALVKYAPEVAQAFVDKPIHFPKSAERDAAPDGQVIIPIARIHELRAAKDAALAAIGRVRAIHVRHKDTHKPDPSVINGNWFCCGAVQLGAVDPYACIACDSPEWPCPTVAALDGAPEPEVKP